jgi:hypothetical protein
MIKLLFGVLTVALLTGPGISAQPKAGSMQGVWQVVDVAIPGPQPRTITFSDRPNLTIITPRHYSRVDEGNGRRVAGNVGTVRCRSRNLRGDG